MKKYSKKHFAIYAVTVFVGLFFSVINIYIAFLLNQVIDIVTANDFSAFYSVNTADYISLLSNDINILEDSFLIPFMLFPNMYSHVLQKQQKKYSEQLSRFTKVSKDYYNGFEVIKSFNLLDIIFRKFNIENVMLANVKIKKDNAFNINESISFFFSFFSQLLILLIGAYLILTENITVGMRAAIIQLSSNFVNPISNIMQAFSKVKSTYPIRKKNNDICQLQQRQ